MARTATVIPEDGLRLRSAPTTNASILGLLKQGQQVTITGAVDRWRRVETSLGAGFAHGDYLSAGSGGPVTDEPAGFGPEIRAEELNRNEDRVGLPLPATYVVVGGDSLSAIGTKLGIDWHLIAAANGLVHPFPIFVGQLLKVPGVIARAGTIDILNPIAVDTNASATSSSNQAHHRPYGGNVSCDIALPPGAGNPGKPAQFFVSSPAGVRVRGVVFSVAPACRSGSINDGGNAVKIMLQHAIGDGEFRDTGAWVLYAHLDPVAVSVDQVLAPGDLIGSLGAPGGREYDSSCARGSHTHIEATNGTSVVDEKESLGRSPVIKIGF